MSFWSNLSVKAPAALGGAAGLAALGSVVFPQYASALQGFAALLGFVSGSLHRNNSDNPATTGSATVTSVLTDTGQQSPATVAITQPVTDVTFPKIEVPTPVIVQPQPQPQPQPVPQAFVTTENAMVMVAQAIAAYKASEAAAAKQQLVIPEQL